jgi:large subunit ribosomal protein L6
MKQKIQEEIEIPSGVSCTYDGKNFVASKGSVSLSRVIDTPSVNIEIKGNKIILFAERGNKNELKYIKSTVAHLKNMFIGLDNKYTYRLEACNVHFPMTLKLDGSFLLINNFLGEKVSRKAKIMPGVEVDVKGAKITVTSHDKESAGETATNIEKATKIKNRDRRIFQDGIFIVEKPTGAKKWA